VISVARGRSDIEGKTDRRPAVAPAETANGASSGDLARQKLVQSHLPLVRSLARRYARRREEYDDLVQAGSVGLVKAASRFDPSRGVAFATFVAPTVEGEIRRQLRDRSKGVTIAGDPVTLGADEPAAESAADAQALAASEIRVLLAGGLRTLDSRERRIVFLRFNADMTERQIAREVGISQAHVSRLLERALTKLRAELANSDSTENAVISTDQGSKIESVGAVKKGQDGVAPAAEASDASTPGRRSSKSKAATGYSGRILVRMPSELHEQLARAAEREDISLNRYVNDALSNSVEADPNQASSGDDPGPNGRRRSAPAVRVALATNLAIVVLAAVVAIVLLALAIQRGI
jgi:RNA polymerase sigma-B factor